MVLASSETSSDSQPQSNIDAESPNERLASEAVSGPQVNASAQILNQMAQTVQSTHKKPQFQGGILLNDQAEDQLAAVHQDGPFGVSQLSEANWKEITSQMKPSVGLAGLGECAVVGSSGIPLGSGHGAVIGELSVVRRHC